MARLDQVTEGSSWQSGSWFIPSLLTPAIKGSQVYMTLCSATFWAWNKVPSSGKVQGRVMSKMLASLVSWVPSEESVHGPAITFWVAPATLPVRSPGNGGFCHQTGRASQESGRYVLKLGKVIIGSINVACRTLREEGEQVGACLGNLSLSVRMEQRLTILKPPYIWGKFCCDLHCSAWNGKLANEALQTQRFIRRWRPLESICPGLFILEVCCLISKQDFLVFFFFFF